MKRQSTIPLVNFLKDIMSKTSITTSCPVLSSIVVALPVPSLKLH
jgi:hypothetical protein